LCLCRYGLPLETIRTGYKSGLEALLEEKPTKAIFLGTRNGDPNAVTSLESNDACLT
jgi:FAD synthetase